MKSRRSITGYSILLVLAGLAINLVFSKLVIFFDIPLFLDSIGTVLAAAVGGYLPGIIVGFCSNLINGISDPITLYYGIISIIIASAASLFASRGWFNKFGKSILAALGFAVIGGGLGSVLTWLLYGFSFGEGISAPFAVLLYENAGFSQFYAQLTADMIIDIVDKVITVSLCFLVIKLAPEAFRSRFPNGHLYGKSAASESDGRAALPLRKRSLRHKVVALISLSSLVLGCSATAISCVLYSGTMTAHYTDTAASIAKIELEIINPDEINDYFVSGETPAYLRRKELLNNLRSHAPDIEYIYVYQIREDGCYVVFDTDTPELEGEKLGTYLPIEDDFLEYKEDLLAGHEIPPIISNGAYGWLLTVYVPVIDSNGDCVAYAAADISMEGVMKDRAVFFIKMASLFFGISIIIVLFALWFAESRLVNPINAIARAADEFAYDGEEERRESAARLQSLNILTGDEIENLYGALKKTAADVSEYISDIKTKADTIVQMQNNIIISFADMVERRDMNTGKHIKHTAAYVGVIARELLREGKYPDILSSDYIDTVVRSAPLHDLGKIKVSDVLLNKPGKLTPEEFEQIKAHTTAGREILLGITTHNISDGEYLSEAVNMAAYHHERWDGTGYPEGLKGEQIPLSARIMAVADVYDALISKRSYKEPMPPDEALEIIRASSGTHFDPEVVAAFIRAEREIVAASQ